MQLAALKHRTEGEDCIVIDHSHVKIKLHTAKDDIKKVFVHYIDNYLPLIDTTTLEAKKAGSDQISGYWTATLTAPYHRIKYTFEAIGDDGSHIIFGGHGIEKFGDEKLREDGLYFKVPYPCDIDRTKTPAWFRDVVWYQIFPERFANRGKGNDPVNVKSRNPEDHPGREDLYGGDL